MAQPPLPKALSRWPRPAAGRPARRTVGVTLATTGVTGARLTVYDERGLRLVTRRVTVTRDATRIFRLGARARRAIKATTRWPLRVTASSKGGARATRKVTFSP